MRFDADGYFYLPAYVGLICRGGGGGGGRHAPSAARSRGAHRRGVGHRWGRVHPLPHLDHGRLAVLRIGGVDPIAPADGLRPGHAGRSRGRRPGPSGCGPGSGPAPASPPPGWGWWCCTSPPSPTLGGGQEDPVAQLRVAGLEVGVGLVVAFGSVLAYRRAGARTTVPPAGSVSAAGMVAGLALLLCQTAFLVVAGAPLFSSSATFFATTPPVSELQQEVGSSLVGWGPNPGYFCVGLGIHPDVNSVFSVHQLALYDPMVPRSYFSAFESLAHRPAGDSAANDYCPALTTVSQARQYGVAYILDGRRRRTAGNHLGGRVGNEDLYHVPGAYPATLTPLLGRRESAGRRRRRHTVAVTHPDPAAGSWSPGRPLHKCSGCDSPISPGGTHRRRQAPDTGELRRGDAPGPHTRRAPSGGAPLLADDVQCRHHPLCPGGRRTGHRPGARRVRRQRRAAQR